MLSAQGMVVMEKSAKCWVWFGHFERRGQPSRACFSIPRSLKESLVKAPG